MCDCQVHAVSFGIFISLLWLCGELALMVVDGGGGHLTCYDDYLQRRVSVYTSNLKIFMMLSTIIFCIKCLSSILF